MGDIFLRHECARTHDWEAGETSWLAQFLKQPGLLVRKKDAHMPWLVPLSDLCTCVMALPVVELEYDEFGMDRQYEVCVPEVDRGFECFIRWCAPIWTLGRACGCKGRWSSQQFPEPWAPHRPK